MSKSRKPASVEAVVKSARADAARKAKSKQALKAHLESAKTDSAPPPAEPPAPPESDEARVARKTAEGLAFLEAMRVDAAATGATLEEVCSEAGVDARTGLPLNDPDAGLIVQRPEAEDGLAKGRKGQPNYVPYSGPMLPLKQARKSYLTGANGNQHCGDKVAMAFSALPREKVVRVIMGLLGDTTNKYAALNEGQQSMNYRNRLRNQLKQGFISEQAVLEAAKAA